ncbi:DUF1189 family protein [Aerococcaceae bacterium 50-4]
MKESNILVILYDALLNYPKIIRVISYSFKRMLVYALLISGISAIPNFMDTLKVFDLLETNASSIVNQIPDYQVTEGKIANSNDQEAFIFETDLITYAFDPKDEMTNQEISSGQNNLITVENNTDNLTLSFIGQPIAFTYAQLGESANSSGVKGIIQSMTTLTWAYYPIIFVIVTLSSLLNLLLASLMIALVIGLLPDSTRLRLTFKMRFSLALASLTMPLMVVTLFNLFGFYVVYQLEIMYIFALIRLWRLLKKVLVIKMKK